MKKKTKKMLTIGAVLVGGYLLLSPPAVVEGTPIGGGGGGGGYVISTEGIPETKKERDITINIEAEKFPSPTGDMFTGGGSRPYDPKTFGGGAGKKDAQITEPTKEAYKPVLSGAPLREGLFAYQQEQAKKQTARSVSAADTFWGWFGW